MANQSNGNSDPVEEHEVVRNKKWKESSLWEEFDKEIQTTPLLYHKQKENWQVDVCCLPHSAEDPLKFWRSHGTHFSLSKRVLAIPPIRQMILNEFLAVQAIWYHQHIAARHRKGENAKQKQRAHVKLPSVV